MRRLAQGDNESASDGLGRLSGLRPRARPFATHHLRPFNLTASDLSRQFGTECRCTSLYLTSAIPAILPKSLRPGAVVIQKPFRESDLVRAIQRALGTAAVS
jgi:hypothetical protein